MASPATPVAENEELVQFSGRIPKSLRRRVKIAAVELDMDAQDIQRRALKDFLERHGF